MGLEQNKITIGFVPLTDMAPLAVAKEKGFFERYGLDVTLQRENSWSQIRDKLAMGELDAAHMLAPMIAASWLDSAFAGEKFVSALVLNLNGNAVTVSNRLYKEMIDADAEAMTEQPATARALRRVLAQRLEDGREPLSIGAVFPYSSHNYALRYWLGAEGVNPDRDARMLVAPPPMMAKQMSAGKLDAFCVGEPWNTVAEYFGIGRAIVCSNEILGNMPEKMLGVRSEWAKENPRTHKAAILSLLEALHWLERRENRLTAADILASKDYVGIDSYLLAPALSGRGVLANRRSLIERDDYLIFHRHGANAPQRFHALWYLTQMARWGQITRPVDIQEIADRAYWPDVYCDAAATMGASYPVEKEDFGYSPETQSASAPPAASRPWPSQGFIDRRPFDPLDPAGYLEGFARHNMRISPGEIVRVGARAPIRK